MTSRAEREHWAFTYGTDAEYRLWLTFQPSCIDGDFSEWPNGEGRNVACHVRSVKAGAGVATKPPFSAVPMTDRQHKLTHQHGNCYFGPPEFWQREAKLHLMRWIASRSTG